jgi:PKD repeat protein
MKKLLPFLIFILSVTLGISQNITPLPQQPINHNSCGFDKVHRHKTDTDTSYREINDNFNQWLSEQTPMRSGPIYQVPVVVHILHRGEAVGTGTNISDADVKLGIEYLNNQWRKIAGTFGDGAGVDVEIEFVLAVRNTSGNCTNGIVRRNMSANAAYMNCGVRLSGGCGITDADAKTGRWNTSNYYNIYLVDKIDNTNCNSASGFTAGYAFMAGSHGTASDGVVLLICTYLDESSGSLAHEMGHAMNLFHTFEGDNNGTQCPTQVNGCGLNAGDCIADIPRHIRTSAIPGLYFDCSNNSANDCQAGTTRQDHMRNYMDYTGCSNQFTQDQKTRTRGALTSTRSSFLASNGNLSLVPPGNATVDFFANATAVCVGTPVKFKDNSSCVPNSFTNNPAPNHTFAWVFSGPATINSSLQNPSINFTTPGTYNVTLTITNNRGTFTLTKNNYITVSTTPTSACTPTSSNVGNFGQTVSNVSFVDINNSTSPIFNTAYSNFACTSTTEVEEGETYPISVTINSGPSGREFFEVYIDYNNNGTFEVGERVFFGNTSSINQSITVNGNITIPTTAVNNTLLRMRVMGEVFAYPSNNKRNCTAAYQIGDVEDYGVFIKGACSSPQQPGNITGNATACVGNTFTYSISNVALATSYNWEVPAGSTINSGNGTNSISVTFNSTGSGQISVTASNDCGTSPARNLTVNVEAAPSGSLTISGSNQVCPGSTQNYSVPNTSGYSYNWNFPLGWTQIDGGSTNQVTVTVGSGAGTVSVIPSNQCGTGTASTLSVSIASSVTPTINIAATPSNSICFGNSVTFNATVTNGGSAPAYQWKVNGINVGTNSASFTSSLLTHNDVVSCVLTSNDACASPNTASSNSITMVVNTIPQPSAITGSNEICQNATNESYFVQNELGVTYTWAVPADASIISGQGTNQIAVDFGANGGVISVVASNTCGNSSAQTLTVIVSTSIVPSVSISSVPDVQAICSGNQVVFSAIAINAGSDVDYEWYLNGTVVGTNSNTYSNNNLNTSDEVYCTITSNSPCASISNVTSSVLIAQVTNVDLSVNSNGNTLTANENNTGYQWLDCNNSFLPVLGANQQSFTPASAGSYAVLLTATNCETTSNCYSAAPLSIRNMDTYEMALFPNPNNGSFNITFSKEIETLEITVTDILGKVILKNSHSNTANVSVKMKESSKGIYFATIKINESETKTIRFAVY